MRFDFEVSTGYTTSNQDLSNVDSMLYAHWANVLLKQQLSPFVSKPVEIGMSSISLADTTLLMLLHYNALVRMFPIT